MGTNYYIPAPPPCVTCKRPHDDIHIGKQSWGWAFLWALHPDDPDDGSGTTEAGWWERLEGQAIVDESDQPVTIEQLRATVDSSRGKQVLTSENIGGYRDPKPYERIGPAGERISLSRGFC